MPLPSLEDASNKTGLILLFIRILWQNKSTMSRKTAPLLPATERLLAALGDRIRLARLRRRLPAKQVAERAGMVEKTLRAIERGSPAPTVGAYAAVLQVLQLENGLGLVAAEDRLGRELQDKTLQGGLRPRRPRRTPAHLAGPAPSPEQSLGGQPPPEPMSAGVSSDALLALLDLAETAAPSSPRPSPDTTLAGKPGRHRRK